MFRQISKTRVRTEYGLDTLSNGGMEGRKGGEDLEEES